MVQYNYLYRLSNILLIFIVCTVGEFTCDTGHCILESSVCDKVDDCGDNSDEHNCPPDSNQGNYTYTL